MNEFDWDAKFTDAMREMNESQKVYFELGADWVLDVMLNQAVEHGFNIRPDAVLHKEIDRMAFEIRKLKAQLEKK